MNEKAIEAAANAFAAVFRERPVQIAHNPDLAGSFFPHIKAAIAALPPLRAREEKPWAFDQACCDAIKDWLREEAPIGARETVHSGHIFWLMTRLKAALSRTAGREWRDISSAIEDYVIGVVREVAELPDRTSPGYDGDMMMVTADELASILRCRFIDGDGNMMTSPLPAPPVAEPLLADKQTVKP